MPITGQETVLQSALTAAITAAIEAQFGGSVSTPNYIPARSLGIANAIIPFFVSNALVTTADVVTIPVTSPPGTPSAGTGVGTGTIS